MALNKKSISSAPTYTNREKGDLEDLREKKTLDFFSLQNTTNEAGESDVLVSFVVKEDKEQFFFASSALKNFLIDNVENAEEKDGAYSFSEDVVEITYKGQKKGKSGRKYNVWEVNC